MTFRNVLFGCALALAACGSKSKVATEPDLAGISEPDLGGGMHDLADTGAQDLAVNPNLDSSVPPPSADNQVAMVVDNGPSGAGGSTNVGFVTVKICAPGGTTCATIDHVSVDTGSVGLRIVSSVIPSNVLAALPVSTLTGGKSISECYIYADGYVFGTVRTADFTLGGETVSAMPIHVIGDKSGGAVPSGCATGQEEDTLETFGVNGIIGIAPYAPDCTSCTTTGQGNPIYYGCAGGTCTEAGIPQTKQVSNPISLFDTDNNGVIIALPDPGDAPQESLSGTITFGIGTSTNNAYPTGLAEFPIGDIDSSDYLDLPGSTVAGKACTQGSFLDTGTNLVYFDDAALTKCTGQDQGLYCPATTTAVACSHTDGNGTKQPFDFNVGNADDIYSHSTNDDTVFKALVGEGGGTCLWGLPFHYGRHLYVGIEGTSVPNGPTTPFEAY